MQWKKLLILRSWNKNYLSEIGMINETDVSLAKASNAVLIGFNVEANESKKLSEEQKIEIRYFNIIYEGNRIRRKKVIWFIGAGY